MDDLVTWLRAIWDEEEAHARKDLWALDRATARGDWSAHYGYNLPRSELRAGDVLVGQLTITRAGLADGEEDQHAVDAFLVSRMVRSARKRAECVLREVEAKRRIVDQYRQAEEAGESVTWTGGEYARILAFEDAIKLLALPHADRPGYRDEWRP